MNKINRQPVIRALELGFGTVSLIKSVTNNIPNVMTYSSVVAKVDQNKTGLSAGLNTRDTVTVEVDNAKYEVGPDANLAIGNKTSRVLNNSYVNSAQYKALLFGSLLYMDEQNIDLIVLGLPVENWHKRDELEKLVVGTHEINGKEFSISQVWIIVQPLGGLLSYANSIGQDKYQELRTMNVLSIDPGYGTLDWVFSQGLKMNEQLSGGADLGMSAVLESVRKEITLSFPQLNDIPIQRIDDAFWKNKGHIRLAGNKYPFPICNNLTLDGNKTNVRFDATPAITDITQSAITRIKNTVGEGGDIDLITVMGGPHNTYLPAIQSAYPDHKITTLKNPIQTICLGMYHGGVQMFEMQQQQKVS